MDRLRAQLAPLGDGAVIDVLMDLHQQADREHFRLFRRLFRYLIPMARRRPLPWSRIGPKLSDLSLAVDAPSGVFAYQMARALRARRIVEFGTSHGISTIYLALAVRDNGGGVVVGTEREPDKAARAQENLERAGLAEFVDIRVGDAPETIHDLSMPVDMLFNDGFPDAMLPVLQAVAPFMRTGAMVLAGNVNLFPADHGDYVAWLRDPANGFCSSRMPLRAGGELSVKVAAQGRGTGFSTESCLAVRSQKVP